MRRLSSTDRASSAPRDADLDVQYRAIGISAVAAAVRYRGESKNPAYAPSENEDGQATTAGWAQHAET